MHHSNDGPPSSFLFLYNKFAFPSSPSPWFLHLAHNAAIALDEHFLSCATHISLSAFILARSQPFSSCFPFPPSPPDPNDLTSLWSLYFFPSVSPTFPPNSYFPPCYPPRSMPPSQSYFMAILLSFFFLNPRPGVPVRV